MMRHPLAVAAMLGAATAFFAGPATAELATIVRAVPPPLPLYKQPPVPGPGYVWLPGYWNYDEEFGYFWVPGTWVEPPRVGLLWTPGFWSYEHEAYAWHAGYWSQRVGFYGGVDYGFGYTGDGFFGSEWRGDRLFYNSAAANVANVTSVTDVYLLALPPNRTVNHVSFNGGPGGLPIRPTPQQIAFGQEPRLPPTAAQDIQIERARQTPGAREVQNHGRPLVAATRQPAELKGPDVVGARTAGTRPAGQAIPQGRHPSEAALPLASARPGHVGAPPAPAPPVETGPLDIHKSIEPPSSPPPPREPPRPEHGPASPRPF